MPFDFNSIIATACGKVNDRTVNSDHADKRSAPALAPSVGKAREYEGCFVGSLCEKRTEDPRSGFSLSKKPLCYIAAGLQT